MTETKNLKLKKPDLADPVNVNDLNDNFDAIDEALTAGSGGLEIDLTAYKLDYSKESEYIDVTSAVPVGVIQDLAQGNKYKSVRLILSASSTATVEILLDGIYRATDRACFYIGTTGNLNKSSWSTLFLVPDQNEDGSLTLTLRSYLNQAKSLVKTVNGIGPDENGNVEVKAAEEKPIHTDLSSYNDGLIVLEYADGGRMNVQVTFDENGNPIKFSNGVEEFTVTWPAEEA